MKLFRTLPYDDRVAADTRGGPLWFPREFQGEGRHDNPQAYGALYVSETPLSAVAEALAVFRGTGTLLPAMLERFGLQLVLIEIELPDNATLIDLDDPAVLRRERLRPSAVATRTRALTQVQAARLYSSHPLAAGLRWWSTLESTWLNVTLFDRVSDAIEVGLIDPLDLAHPVVIEAAEVLGLLV